MFKAYARAFSWLNVTMAIYIALVAVLAVGWWRLVCRRRDILALSLPFYLLLYITYGMEAGARFLVPVVGLLMVCLWHALARWGDRRQAIFAGLLVAHAGAAVAYWVGVEIPRGREMNRHWETVEQLVDQIRSRPGPGAVLDCPEHVQLMLTLVLDRPVQRVTDDNPLLADCRWLVMPSGDEPQPGFCPWRP